MNEEKEAIFKNSNTLNIIKESLESSSIHAIPNIIRNKNSIIKLIWFLCFIISTSVCIWFIINSINDFLKFEVTTKIDVVYQTEVIFPVVSICNLNPFTTSFSKEHFKKSYGISDERNIVQNYYQALIQSRIDESNRHLLSKNIDEEILNCQFLLSNCSINEDFERFYDLNYGNCIRFNSGKNMIGKKIPQKLIQKIGITGSLDLELFIGNSNQNYNPFTKINGFNIFITNESTLSTYGEGLIISPGTSTRIILNKYSIIKQPSPYSECVGGLNSIDSYHSDCYRKLVKQNKTSYSYNKCVRMCFLKNLAYSVCKCQVSYYDMVYDSTLRSCGSDNSRLNKDFECITEAWNKVFKNITVLKECDCPFECQKHGYSSTLSTAEFPTRYYYDYLINTSSIKTIYSNLSYEEMKQSIAKVEIFYDELKETIISQEIKTSLADLISNIGGILGLFLGNIFLLFIFCFYLKLFLFETQKRDEFFKFD